MMQKPFQMQKKLEGKISGTGIQAYTKYGWFSRTQRETTLRLHKRPAMLETSYMLRYRNNLGKEIHNNLKTNKQTNQCNDKLY